MTRKYIVTTAVNDTKAHQGFMDSIAHLVAEGYELKIMAAMYKNPTAKRGKAKRIKDQTYDAQLVPYLTRKDVRLGRNITLFGSVPVQPTANTALSGLEVYASGTSGIIGHVKRQMQVIPTDDRTPRVLWTTGACTLAKYSRTRAGARAKKHHVIGALIVECERGGEFFVRNVTANADGSFTDLDKLYTPKGVKQAPRALSVTLGDIHVGHEDEDVLAASEELVSLLRPQHLVLHDVYDGSSRSHHRMSTRDRWDTRYDLVENEVVAVSAALRRFQSWGATEMDIVRSNHDEHLTRWLEEFDHKKDIVNDPYYCALKARCYDFRKEFGRWPNELELECRRLGLKGLFKFLDREESLKIGDVQHAFHGDKGVNGSRGSLRAYAKLGVKVTIGHSHTPGILDGAFQTGVTASKLMGYNHMPSTWLHAHVVLGADGKRQLIIIVGGRFRADPV